MNARKRTERGKGTREEGKDRMKEPQSFRFRAAAAVASRAWPMEEGLPPSFHPSHLLRYPLARPPARPPPPVLSHAPVPVLTPSLVRRRPRGHLAVSQGVRQLVQHVTTAKADGPPLLSYSPHPPLPSFLGRRQRPTKGRLCRRLPEQQHRSRPAGQRRQAGGERRRRPRPPATGTEMAKWVSEAAAWREGAEKVPFASAGPFERGGWRRAGAEGGSIESVEERTAAAAGAVDGRLSLWPPHLTVCEAN